MLSYKFLRKKVFERLEQFEGRINDEATRGWQVVNFTGDGNGILVLLEKKR